MCFFFFTGKAHDKNWVQQWPSEVYKTPGENLTMHCQTHGGLRKAMCLVQWFIKNSNGNFDSIDQFIQFRERYSQHKNTTHFRQSFTLLSLKLNDTGSFHCNYLCKSNSTYEQYYGNGTQLFVHFRTENVTLSTAIFNSNITGKKRILKPFLFFATIFHYR